MTEPVVIILDGDVIGKGRPRMTRSGHAYTPAKTRSYESALRYAAQQEMGDRPLLEGPLAVALVVQVAIPAGWPKWKQEAALVGGVLPTVKPDWDNQAKVLDSLNKVVWSDDQQIVRATVSRAYASKPRLIVRVEPVDGLPAQVSKRPQEAA